MKFGMNRSIELGDASNTSPYTRELLMLVKRDLEWLEVDEY